MILQTATIDKLVNSSWKRVQISVCKLSSMDWKWIAMAIMPLLIVDKGLSLTDGSPGYA